MSLHDHPHHETWPRKLRCKDGLEVTLRPLEAADFESLLAFFQSMPREDRLFLRYDVFNVEFFRQLVLESLQNGRYLRLLAFHEGSLVGHGLLEPDNHLWSPHVGEVRIMVRKEFRRHSLGALLMRELVDQASLRLFDKLTVRLMDTQAAVRAMCERAGFQIEAELKNHVRDLDGKKHTLLLMSCSLDDAWHAMEFLLEDVAPWTI
ncbi:MAG: GNAT family N-acetyltransferase [Myxococcales bacterium]|jgi:RimJ/RimL family protein N-acetyltransferase|nr:GNAT family N-acetyltransferase [Myxococcales bacterium]